MASKVWHVGEQNLKSLANGKLVERLTTTHQETLVFVKAVLAESSTEALSTVDSSVRQTGDLLELVHSDVCGKISDKSIGGPQYFLTFTDDKSRYSWIYIIKTKDQVFQYFLEWKLLKGKLEPSEQTMEVNTLHLSLRTTSKQKVSDTN